MSDAPSAAQMATLPHWAQAYIQKLTREREEALRALREWSDSQTPSPIYIDEFVLTGEGGRGPTTKRRYITTDQLEVEHTNIHLRILLRQQGDNGPARIELQWSAIRPPLGHVGFIPSGFQAADLIAPKDLRT
jgi:hypothetical protein